MTAHHPKFQVQADGWVSAHGKGQSTIFPHSLGTLHC